MRVNECQRLQDRDKEFNREMETAPPFSTLWGLRIAGIEARAKGAFVQPGAVILTQEYCRSCYFMYATVIEVRKHRVKVRWQREGTEQWVPYLATYEGSRRHPLREEATAARYRAALRANRIRS